MLQNLLKIEPFTRTLEVGADPNRLPNTESKTEQFKFCFHGFNGNELKVTFLFSL